MDRFACPHVDDFVKHDIDVNQMSVYVCLWTPFMLQHGAEPLSVSVYIRKRTSTGAGHVTLDDFDSFHVRPSKSTGALAPINMDTIESLLAQSPSLSKGDDDASDSSQHQVDEKASQSSTSSWEKEQQMRTFMLQNDLDYLYE
jgi:hypothetical protein